MRNPTASSLDEVHVLDQVLAAGDVQVLDLLHAQYVQQVCVPDRRTREVYQAQVQQMDEVG